MATLRVRLFGRLTIERDGLAAAGLTAGKVQELLCFLLIHRDRAHSRETLADLLWGGTTTAHSKKYLRQALWQLQGALRGLLDGDAGPLLSVDADAVRLNSTPAVWVDVAVFEQAVALAHGVPGERLDDAGAAGLGAAAQLYRADLLDGWFAEWCLAERDRLQAAYLTTLDKLIDFSEARRQYEAGLQYGGLALRCDRAREATHQRLMRLHYLAGDRAAALRQYDRCTIALDQELDVAPCAATSALYERIRAGEHLAAADEPTPSARSGSTAATLRTALMRLRELEARVADIHLRLQTQLDAVERALDPARTADAAGRPPLRVASTRSAPHRAISARR